MDRRREIPRFRIEAAHLEYRKAWQLGLLGGYDLDRGGCRMIDMSREGLQFRAAERPQRNTSLELSLEVPAVLDRIDLRSEVRWCSGQGGEFRVGVEFLENVPEGVRSLLDHNGLQARIRTPTLL